MARSYDAAVTALAVRAPFKWIDNLLSRHRVPGVEQGPQGATRRLSPSAILQVAIIRLLNEELEIPIRRAVELAAELTTTGGSHTLSHGTGRLSLQLDTLERTIASRLADAVETAPRPRRGRPPARRSPGVLAD